MTTTLRRSAAVFVALAMLVASAFFAQSASAYDNDSITANPASGPAGSTTTVTGQNFTPGDSVSLSFHSVKTDVGTATVGADGTFSQEITVPSDAALGAHTITATDADDAPASTPFNVTGGSGTEPVSVSTTTPAVGGSLTVSGQSCTPGGTVAISLDNGTYPLATVTAGSDGTYSTTVTLPSGVSGKHQLTVSGAGCSGVEALTIGGSGGGGNLAGTGVAVIGLGALGVVLLIGGGLMLLAGRRRRVTAA